MERMTLSKEERLCGRDSVAELFAHGKSLSAGCFRCRFLANGTEQRRFMVSVPKRSFKRAVKRNLLKRRIREAYRQQKALLPSGTDILFVYTATEVLEYNEIYAAVGEALSAVNNALQP